MGKSRKSRATRQWEQEQALRAEGFRRNGAVEAMSLAELRDYRDRLNELLRGLRGPGCASEAAICIERMDQVQRLIRAKIRQNGRVRPVAPAAEASSGLRGLAERAEREREQWNQEQEDERRRNPPPLREFTGPSWWDGAGGDR